MELNAQIEILFWTLLFTFILVPDLILVLKNRSLLTPSPTNNTAIFFRIVVALFVLFGSVFLQPEVLEENNLLICLIIGFTLCVLFPLFIPSEKIELISQGGLGRGQASIITFAKVRFKKGFENWHYVWLGRFALIIIPIIISILLNK